MMQEGSTAPKLETFGAAEADNWVYGDFAPDPDSKDLVGLKARWLLDELPVKADPVVLDYGAGEGKHLHLIRSVRPNARLVGVDIRPVRRDADFEFHRVGARDPLPFESQVFDLVVSCDVLEHVEDIQRSLDEIERVLRPGGAFIGFVPCEGGVGPHAFFRMFAPHIYRDTKDHNHAYRLDEMQQWFAQRFRVVNLNYSYHFLGASLDAVFFASFKAPVLGPRLEGYWRGQENAFYRGDAAPKKPSVVGRMVQAANRMAFLEARLLRRSPIGAKGLHFHLVKP